MKRLCLIGNSHLAAMKLGWDRLRESYPGMSLTFFGSRGGEACKNLRLVKGALVPSQRDAENFRWTSGGLGEIELGDYDQFAVVSLGFRPQNVYQVARGCSFADARLDQSKLLVSRECFADAITDALLRSTAAAVTTTIRAAADKPVLLLPQAASSIETTKTEHFRAAYGAAPAQCWAVLSRLWTECATSMASRLGAAIMFQPPETVRNYFFTAHEFCRGSLRLTQDFSKRHPDDDFTHMNADYGVVMMKSVLDALAK